MLYDVGLDDVTITVVPEPATGAILFGLGVLGFAFEQQTTQTIALLSPPTPVAAKNRSTGTIDGTCPYTTNGLNRNSFSTVVSGP